MSPTDPPAGSRAARFDRQARFAPLGERGQERIEASTVLLVGCGALGGHLAMTMTRCGVGRLVLVDRDVVELSNLPRQVLFEERHLGRAKVDAARESLERIGGPTELETHARHVDAEDLPELLEAVPGLSGRPPVDLVLDGTDNLATRYLINDLCVERGLPWVYGGVVGGSGLVLPVLPGAGACLRCLFPDPPAPGSLPTCDTAGVILPAVGAIASLQAGAALRWLASDEDRRAAWTPELLEIDAWAGGVRSLALGRDPDCPCCGAREFPFLHAPVQRSAVTLCGRNTVQVRPSSRSAARPDLGHLARSLGGAAQEVQQLGSLLRFDVESFRVTVFPDGRALIEGTEDADRARAVYDRYVGA